MKKKRTKKEYEMKKYYRDRKVTTPEQIWVDDPTKKNVPRGWNTSRSDYQMALDKKRSKITRYFRNEHGDKMKLFYDVHYKNPWGRQTNLCYIADMNRIRVTTPEKRYYDGNEIKAYSVRTVRNEGKEGLSISIILKGSVYAHHDLDAKRTKTGNLNNIMEAIRKHTDTKKTYARTTREIMFGEHIDYEIIDGRNSWTVSKDYWLNRMPVNKDFRQRHTYNIVYLAENPAKNTVSIGFKFKTKKESRKRRGFMARWVYENRIILNKTTGAIYLRTYKYEFGTNKVSIRRWVPSKSFIMGDEMSSSSGANKAIAANPEFVAKFQEMFGIKLTYIAHPHDILRALIMEHYGVKYPDILPNVVYGYLDQMDLDISNPNRNRDHLAGTDDIMKLVQGSMKFGAGIRKDIQKKNAHGGLLYPNAKEYIKMREAIGQWWPSFNRELLKSEKFVHMRGYGYGRSAEMLVNPILPKHNIQRALRLTHATGMNMKNFNILLDHMSMMVQYIEKADMYWSFRAKSITELNSEHSVLSKALRRISDSPFIIHFDPKFVKAIEEKVEGYNVILMKTWDDFFEQGERQDNCSYSYHNRYKRMFLLSIKEGTAIKYTAAFYHDGSLNQMFGKHNSTAPGELVEAVHNHVKATLADLYKDEKFPEPRKEIIEDKNKKKEKKKGPSLYQNIMARLRRNRDAANNEVADQEIPF